VILPTHSYFVVMFMYSYWYVCNILCILFHFVFLCIVCVSVCYVLLLPGVNPVAVDKYLISYHIISYHIISYHIISYHNSTEVYNDWSYTCSPIRHHGVDSDFINTFLTKIK
jgi:hypothetical protein